MRPMLWLFGPLLALAGCAVTPINIPVTDDQGTMPGDLRSAGVGDRGPQLSLETGAPPSVDMPRPGGADGGVSRDAGAGELRPAELGPGKDGAKPAEAGPVDAAKPVEAGKKKDGKP